MSFKCQTVLFDLLIGPYQVLPFWTSVDQRAMAVKAYSAFLKVPAGTSPSNCFVLYPVHSLEKSYFSADMQSVYSAVTTNWPIGVRVHYIYIYIYIERERERERER